MSDDVCGHLEGFAAPDDTCEYRATWTNGNPVPIRRTCWRRATAAVWTEPAVVYSACEAHAEGLAVDLQAEGLSLLTFALRD
jgi:hypothetical protein